MIKAEELMIGNWVLDGTKYAQVTSITCDGIIETTVNEKSNIELLEPIPITKEILEKNGFEEKREPERYIKSDDYYDVEIREYNDGLWILTLTDCEFTLPHSQVHVSYVHQLQQALRLYGIPETIEL